MFRIFEIITALVLAFIFANHNLDIATIIAISFGVTYMYFYILSYGFLSEIKTIKFQPFKYHIMEKLYRMLLNIFVFMPIFSGFLALNASFYHAINLQGNYKTGFLGLIIGLIVFLGCAAVFSFLFFSKMLKIRKILW